MNKINLFLAITAVVMLMSTTMNKSDAEPKNPVPQGIFQTQHNSFEASLDRFLLDFTLKVDEKYDDGITKDNYFTEYTVVVKCQSLGYQTTKTYNILKKEGLRIAIDVAPKSLDSLLLDAYAQALQNHESLLFELFFYPKNRPDSPLFVLEQEVYFYE